LERELPEKAPNFEAEIARFQQFLRVNQFSATILWIQPEDLLITGKRLLYVRFPVSKTREVVAQQTFEKGIGQQRGALLKALFELEGQSFCFVWVSENNDEAARAFMPAGVKLSIYTDRIPVTAVRSRLWWWCLKTRFRRKQVLREELFR
jgi:hypothetical protein